MSDTTLQYKASLDGSGFASGAAQINSHLHQMGINTSAASANLGGLGTLLGTMANPLTLVALGITAIGGALVGSAQASAAWESSMTGVAKTTGLAGPELEKLSQDLLQMSTTVPLAASELASIAAAGGSLGIAKEELAGFTLVASQMGVGFEMSADQAATSGAKILNAFGQKMNTDNLSKLGSVVNTMGDSFAATEPQVLDFLNRASFLNSTMGQSIPQVAALGTTLISTGLEAEVAATGIKSMLNMLTSETSKTGGMDNWAKLMGTSVDELKQKVATDLNSTLIETANKIAAIEDPVERFQAAVQAAGSEGAPALLKLAGQQENYQKALGMTNAEWEKASSLQKTFDAQSATVNSQWTMFTNTLSLAATELGTGMLPALGDAIGFMTDLAKIGIKVGETINDSVVKPLADLWSMGDTDSTPSGLEMAWSAAKDWAGIGTEHAEQVAKEMSENEKLQNAGAEALQAGIDAGVLKDPAKNAGKEFGEEFSKEFEKEFKTQMADQEIAKILARDTSVMSKKSMDESIRDFEYLGEQFEVIVKSHTGSAIGDWYEYSLKSGDVMLQNTTSGMGYLDPLKAFELATGLPAPEEGTAAYYRLMGDEIAAKKVELQEALKVKEFDYTDISDIFGPQFTSRLENEGTRIAATSSEKVQDAYQSLLDALKEPTWDNLDEVLTQMDSLVAEHELDPSEAALWADNYKEVLLSGIVDISEFAKSQSKDLNSQITDAFSDFDFSTEDKKLVMAMKPMLDAVKEESPKAFGESGLAGIDKFIEMVENGASSSELYAYFKTLGTTAGHTFAEAMNSNFGEIDFDWNKMWGKNFLSSLSDLDAFAKNMFQPELIELSSDALERYNTGTDEYILQAEQMVDSAVQLAEENKWLFTDEDYDALMEYKDGAMSLGSVLSILADKVNDSNEEVKKFTKEVDDAESECGKLISTFGAWQELNSSLWKSDYIGPSYGEEYDNALVMNAAYTVVAAESSQRYADSLHGVVNAKSEELKVSEYLLETGHDGKLSDEDRALAVRTYGIELTSTNEKAQTLAETLANFDNEFQGDISKTISFDSDLPQHNEIVSTLTLDTVTALSEYEAFRANIEGTVITAKLSTQIETTADRLSSQGIDLSDEQPITRKMTFKTATPGLGTQAGTQNYASILQNIYTSLDRNTTRQITTLSTQFSSTRAAMTLSTTSITTSISSAADSISGAVNDAALFIVDSILNNQGGTGSGMPDEISSGSSSFWSGTSPVGTSGALFSYSFSEGGYVDRPTFAIVGDSPGGEYMVPAEKLDSFLMGMSKDNSLSLDSTGMQSQLQSAISSLSIPPIPVRLAFEVDSEAVRAMLTDALYDILAGVRL